LLELWQGADWSAAGACATVTSEEVGDAVPELVGLHPAKATAKLLIAVATVMMVLLVIPTT
jgi:hypothetical protein